MNKIKNLNNEIKNIEIFIKDSWKETIRENKEDNGSLIGLPYKYTVVCKSTMFQEMYYWDTYFANKGLIAQGFVELAKNNIDNLRYLLRRFGKVLNGNRTYYLNRSQPPYLSMMVKDVYDITKDNEWLNKCYIDLEKEYDFWMTRRVTDLGLNRYGCDGDNEYYLASYEEVCNRLKINCDEEIDYIEKIYIGENYRAECESGWDSNPRFSNRCKDFIPIDLNSNLYIYEDNFVYFSKCLGKNYKTWDERKEKRSKLINKYCWNDEVGGYFDYDYVNNKQSNIISSAVFHLLWAGIADYNKAERIVGLLSKLECEYGLAACENIKTQENYQWHYPNGWAPLHYISVFGLEKYGFKNEALRIAEKYIRLSINNFLRTGSLWEKYNVVSGDINTSNEYEMPEMLGWTAGVFIALGDYLKINNYKL